MIELIFYSLIGGLFSLVGGMLLLWKTHLAQKSITPFISFGAGAFLAAAFLDILPEALELGAQPQPVFLATLTGFIVFFVIERFLMRFVKRYHTGDDHSDHTESLAFLLILGDSLHNVLDGIVIGLTYSINPLLALPTTLAVAAHELPQEIGDFSVLLKLKWDKRTIIVVNVVQSLLALPGAILGYSMGQYVTPHLPLLLGATAGIFLYISASDLIPELHHQSGHKHFFRVVLPLLTSVILIYFLSNLAHGG